MFIFIHSVIFRTETDILHPLICTQFTFIFLVWEGNKPLKQSQELVRCSGGLGVSFLWLSLWPRAKIPLMPLHWDRDLVKAPGRARPDGPAPGKSPSILCQYKSCSQSLCFRHGVAFRGNKPWQRITTTKFGLRTGAVP